ncbi:MAG: vitamin K epoxide reductase family protein [Pyrinomonadaceae bacterium]|nr:vitamin K epoxide reductase family protein [Pyrinomonadaceae bacterium]
MSVAKSDEAAETKALNEQTRGTTLYIVASILALIGLADSVYLTIQHLKGYSVQCTITSGCEEVLTSAYATIGGYPLAAFGAAAYFAAFSLATLALFGYTIARKLLLYLVAVMLLVTLFLLYVQAFVLGKWCQYCLLSAAVTFCLTAIVAVERFVMRRG